MSKYDEIICFYCNKVGHKKINCFLLYNRKCNNKSNNNLFSTIKTQNKKQLNEGIITESKSQQNKKQIEKQPTITEKIEKQPTITEIEKQQNKEKIEKQPTITESEYQLEKLKTTFGNKKTLYSNFSSIFFEKKDFYYFRCNLDNLLPENYNLIIYLRENPINQHHFIAYLKRKYGDDWLMKCEYTIDDVEFIRDLRDIEYEKEINEKQIELERYELELQLEYEKEHNLIIYLNILLKNKQITQDFYDICFRYLKNRYLITDPKIKSNTTQYSYNMAYKLFLIDIERYEVK
jgi:hypothetical protein